MDGALLGALGLSPALLLLALGARPAGARAQVSALIKVRHEEAGAILGIEGEKLGQCRCWASAPTRLYPVHGALLPLAGA